MNKTVAFYTLGCKLNFSETSSIGRIFEEKGFEKVPFEERADIYVINTCSVTENADKKCRKTVDKILQKAPDAFVALVGCYAQLKPEEVASIPGVDAVFGANEKFRMLEFIETFEKTQHPRIYAREISEAKTFNNAYSLNDRTRTFLKVQDGCNYHCSFCTIPMARGESRSDSIENILKSAHNIVANGVKEIVLTGVNTGDFGIQDGKRKERFTDLVRELDQVEGLERVRISSIEPNLISNEIIDFVAASNKFVPHFHIPLQSGSDNLLKSMRRRYRTDLYRERVEHIKRVMPEACIGVDVIVGYPGETEEEFLKTYNFLNELNVSYLHVFTYSSRAGTPAEKMGNQVQWETRLERSKMLRTLSEKKRRHFYEQNLGSTRKVLFETDISNGKIHGFTENYVRVAAPADENLINQTLHVSLDEINEKGNVETKALELAEV